MFAARSRCCLELNRSSLIVDIQHDSNMQIKCLRISSMEVSISIIVIFCFLF